MESYRCPCREEPLAVTGQARLQTLAEHVFAPNDLPSMKDKYECLNERCPTRGRTYWDYDGALYGQPFGIKWKGDLNSALGSIERQLEAENEMRGRKWLHLGLIQLVFSPLRTADKEGNILKTRWGVQVCVRDRGHWIHWVPGPSILLHLIRDFNEDLRRYRESHTSWHAGQLLRHVENDSLTHRKWWRKMARAYARWRLSLAHLSDKELKEVCESR